MTEQIIPSKEKLPLDYPLPTAIGIYAARLGILLIIVLANLIAFVAVFIIPNWIAPILGFLVLILVLVYIAPRIKKIILARQIGIRSPQRPYPDLQQGTVVAESTFSIGKQIALAAGLVVTSLLLLFQFYSGSPAKPTVVGLFPTETRMAFPTLMSTGTYLPTAAIAPMTPRPTATRTSAQTPVPLIATYTPTPWWWHFTPPPCEENTDSDRVTELPCLYQVQHNDSWYSISLRVYDQPLYFVLLLDLNRLDNGKYRPLYENDVLYIPNIFSDSLPLRFPWCIEENQPPCQHPIHVPNIFEPPLSYESIARAYFPTPTAPLDEIISCIQQNNLDSDGKPYSLNGLHRPEYITIPICP